jgi:transcriptional activator of cad operon
MSRGETLVRLEDRPLRLLLCLAEHAGDVLSIEELLKQVWPGVIVSPDSIYQAITALRRQLGDDPKQPTYIATVPRRGYRLIATVTSSVPPSIANQETPPGTSKAQRRLPAAALIVLLACLVAMAVLAWNAKKEAAPTGHARAVTVVPFLDLTDQMSEEPFAEGMADELIAKLSKVPGLAVSSTAALKAKALKAGYVLDGSVRKSGSTLRVTARLTRASDGVVAWSDTYDRSWSDKLMIQEDIAGEVSKALTKSLSEAARPSH